jgi:hypothetical protein
VGLAEVPGQRRLLAADHGQRAGPERLDGRPEPRGDVDGEGVERRRSADQHRWRHLPPATLGVEEVLHRTRIERIGRDAVDRVGGEHDELALLEGRLRRQEPAVELLVHAAVELHPVILERATPSSPPPVAGCDRSAMV